MTQCLNPHRKTLMNKQDKVVVAILGAMLAGYLLWNMSQPKAVAPAVAPVAPTQVVSAAPAVAMTPTALTAAPAPATTPTAPAVAEKIHVLTNDNAVVQIGSNGAVIRSIELKQYRQEDTEDSAKVVLETANIGAIDGLPELASTSAYTLVSKTDSSITLKAQAATGLTLTRRIDLLPNYEIAINDTFTGATALPAYTLSAGALTLPTSPNDLLSADNYSMTEEKTTIREGKLSKLYNVSSGFMGCGGAPQAAGLPAQATEVLPGPQGWLALKSQFFMTAMIPDNQTTGATLSVARDLQSPTLKITAVSGVINYAPQTINQSLSHTTRIYAGPKKYDLLKDLAPDMDEVMEFGFFSWFCKLLLPTLNFFYNHVYANYGIAILLLTILVRILFWPLTHKSTVSMKKMQSIQPKLKAVQEEFKGNPQKIQQETLKIYRENKVNPMASCLPMLVQIPIFIALFTVLRNAIELRFEDFLWISDLSQPENLLKGVLPLPLNILPILTAVTMGLQTALTPGTGDPAQKKMMTWMMPTMLLFMFYSMASALCLYWTVSQVLSIAQMLWIQRKSAATSN